MTLERDFEKIARELGLSTVVLKRLMGDAPVKTVIGKPPVHLGLRMLAELKKFPTLQEDQLKGLLKCIAEIKAHCPHVYRWLTHGGFDPTKIPDEVNRARLQHAARTFGRVRAQFLRSCGKTVGEF